MTLSLWTCCPTDFSKVRRFFLTNLFCRFSAKLFEDFSHIQRSGILIPIPGTSHKRCSLLLMLTNLNEYSLESGDPGGVRTPY